MLRSPALQQTLMWHVFAASNATRNSFSITYVRVLSPCQQKRFPFKAKIFAQTRRVLNITRANILQGNEFPEMNQVTKFIFVMETLRLVQVLLSYYRWLFFSHLADKDFSFFELENNQASLLFLRSAQISHWVYRRKKRTAANVKRHLKGHLKIRASSD